MFPLTINEAFWKATAIALFGALLASSAYLGYHWQHAASERDDAVKAQTKAEGERDAANKQIGELQGIIRSQNDAVKAQATKTKQASEMYLASLQRSNEYESEIGRLMGQIGQEKSQSCEQALAKQRRVVEGLNGIGSKK